MNKLIFFLLSIGILSCVNSNCKNSNPIFDNEKPESKSYKTELIEKLKLSSDKSFFVDKYISDKSGDFFYVKIVGKDLCAIGIFKIIKNNPKLDEIKRAKGMGYNGAELYGFSYNIIDNELVFINLEKIID